MFKICTSNMYAGLLAAVLVGTASASPSLVYAANGGDIMPMVAIETDKGTITIELNRAKAEKSVDNFLAYVDEGFYDGLIFHRVIPGFMVQGGGFESGMKMRNPSRPNIENEADNGLENDRGTIAMARTSDPHSASSQFFINVADNDFLNHTGKDLRGWGYAVFGRVTSCMDVLDAIVALPTAQFGSHGDVPTQEIKIIRATRLDADKSE